MDSERELTELLEAIEAGLESGASESRSANSEWGYNGTVDPDITRGLLALHQLWALLTQPPPAPTTKGD